jgi:dipeptidyl aminopeptidase/acylaminoacyl peptidase
MRAVLSALLAWFCTAALGGVELDSMLAPSAFTSMNISPDGQQLAAISFDGVRSTLLLIDTKTLAQRNPIQPQGTRSPIRAEWINAGLLAVDFDDLRSEAIDLNGKTQQLLGQRFLGTRRERGAESDWVLVFDDVRARGISQVNLRTGEHKKVRVALPGKLTHWAFDTNGSLRAVTMTDTAFWSDKIRTSNWYRVDEDSEWQLLEESPLTADSWVPMHVPAEPNTLIVRSHHRRDTAALFRYDTLKQQHLEMVAGHASGDVLAALGLEQAGIYRVITSGIKPQSHWFDARWAALQARVDAELPGRINLLSGDPAGRLLVFSYGDVDPGRWFVLDAQDQNMWPVAAVKPTIDPTAMRTMAPLEYRAMDGLTIPAYLTRPAGADTPAPLVVLVHGGPHMRDDWLWNEEVQILAANGYAVFQPQFRGSTGFGQRFQEAGYGQWGRAMQDDITAGVRHLVENGLADPQRICIVGASYGGYAALWGSIKTPALYKCGISFAGVSDIEHMLNDNSDRNDNPVVREMQRSRIGDLSQAEQLAQVSPLRQAAHVGVPLLLAHGSADERVPISHSRRMVEALQRNGKAHEWLAFDNEGHHLAYTKNKRRYYEAMLDFLNRHIGPAAAPQVRTAGAP